MIVRFPNYRAVCQSETFDYLTDYFSDAGGEPPAATSIFAPSILKTRGIKGVGGIQGDVAALSKTSATSRVGWVEERDPPRSDRSRNAKIGDGGAGRRTASGGSRRLDPPYGLLLPNDPDMNRDIQFRGGRERVTERPGKTPPVPFAHAVFD